jgi:hypothetical protein
MIKYLVRTRKNMKKDIMVIEEGAMDWLHAGLDLAGLIPGIGEPFDAANAILYAKQGDWMNAALSAISMVPEIGDLFGKGGKIVLLLEKLITKGGRSGKLAEKILQHAPQIVKTITEGFKKYKNNKTKITAFLDGLSQTQNEKLKGLAPYAEKIKQSLTKVEKAYDNIVKLSQAVSKTKENPQEPEIDKKEAENLIKEMVFEENLKTIIINEIRLQINR